MFDFTVPRRLPAAGIDPIDTPYEALSVIRAVMSPVVQFETIVLTLDPERRGRALMVVTGTDDPASMLGIVDMITELALGDPEAGGVVLASVRPRGGVGPADLERWSEADELCDAAGIELVEWFVMGSTIDCPRELCGVAPRWRS